MSRKYFIYKGKLVSLHDAQAVTKAFEMFLLDNNILDEFSTLLYTCSQRTVYEHVLLATPIGRRNILETQIKTDSGRAEKAAIIRLTEGNYEYCFDHLITNDFALGFVLDKDKRSFSSNRTAFLKTIVDNKLMGSKIFSINLLKTLARRGNQHKSFFQIGNKGNDEGVLQFFALDDEVFKSVEEAVVSDSYVD